jgi:hypothetical protein
VAIFPGGVLAQAADKRVTHTGAARETASVKAEAAAPEWAGWPRTALSPESAEDAEQNQESWSNRRSYGAFRSSGVASRHQPGLQHGGFSSDAGQRLYPLRSSPPASLFLGEIFPVRQGQRSHNRTRCLSVRGIQF